MKIASLLLTIAALVTSAGAFQPQPSKTKTTTTTPLSKPLEAASNFWGQSSDKWAPKSIGSSGKQVVLEPNYQIAGSVAFAAPTVFYLYGIDSQLGVAGSLIHAVLAIYLYKQTQRVRCVFDKNSFEFKNLKNGQLITKPNKNYVKGTINKWDCSKTVDFGYVPNKSFPLITWFKETETPPGTWGQYGLWGKIWSNVGDLKGAPSIHFFPGFIDMKTFETEMLARGATKKD